MNLNSVGPTKVLGLVQLFLLLVSSPIVADQANSMSLDPNKVKIAATYLSKSHDEGALGEGAVKAKSIDYLHIFNEDLRKYKPNAPWITESFMDMSFAQFGIAFKRIVKILTIPQERWFYFSDSPQDFDSESYWPQFLWQCIYYEQWMGKLSLDAKQLVYKDVEHPRLSFIKILSTLEELEYGKKLVEKYYQFYAFYTDCLSHFFCTAVYSCYESINDNNAYKYSLTIAKKSLSKMKQNLIVLRKSNKFYPAYKMTLDSYKNILALLEAEKIKTNLR